MKKFDVFPAKILKSGQLYYYITYSVGEQLVIRDDGVVLPVDEIKRVAMIANAYYTSVVSTMKYGGRWIQSSASIKDKFQKLQRTLEELYKLIKNQAPTIVLIALESYMEVPMVMIENQAKIEENINKCEELATATNDVKF